MEREGEVEVTKMELVRVKDRIRQVYTYSAARTEGAMS